MKNKSDNLNVKPAGGHSSSLRQLGVSLVEFGLLICLIAVIAIPAVNRVGIQNTCTLCKLRYCQKYDNDFDYCGGGPAGRRIRIVGNPWDTCVDSYYEGFSELCESTEF